MAFLGVSNAVLEGGLAFYNYGASVPVPENQAYPWFRTTDGRWYIYSGSWISPVNYSLLERRWFAGTLVELVTYDGGDAGAPSDRSGPMWVEDTAFIGRSPMHPGAIPSSDPAKSLALGEDYGAGSHTNTMLEMPEHTHQVKYAFNQTGAGLPCITGNGTTESIQYPTEATGEATPDPYSIVGPVRGIYCIKWSGRQYYRV